ncbi:MAG: metallophosphoesterase family protein, partial [Longimicrobiales bacterium]
MLTLLHISDLHFGPHFVAHVGEALLHAAAELQPDIVVISGDFTQRAKRAQYQEARAYIDRLPRVPTVVVPGNHDVPLYRVAERVFRPYELYKEYISTELDTVLRHDEAVIVALDSTSPLTAITNGRIQPWQLDFCERAFEAGPVGVSRVVVAHHHFAPAPDYERAQVMPRAKRALDRFKKLKVDMVLGGHLHRAYIGNSLDVYPGVDREHGIIIV